MARTQIHKKCLFCGNDFVCDTRTARQMYCSVKCGLKSRNRKRKVDIKKLKDLVNANVDIYKICDTLGETYWVIRKVMTENNIRYPKKPYKVREDGYWNYNTEKNHRKIVERFIGRKLLKTEQVHHIDGNKQNNDISNLCLLSSCGEHARLHKQLESVALELLKEGIIYFDYDQKLYKIKRVK